MSFSKTCLCNKITRIKTARLPNALNEMRKAIKCLYDQR